MATTEQVHAWWSKLYDAARIDVIRATVPILAFQNDTAIQAGSGVLFKIADQHFVFTAAHVLDLAIEHGLPLTLGPSEQEGPPVSIERLTGWRSPFPKGADPKDKDARQDDPYDAGWFEIPSEIAAKIAAKRRFARLPEVDLADIPSQGCYFILGYPHKLSLPDIPSRHLHVSTVHYLTELGQPPLDKNGRLNLQYRLDSFDRSGDPREAPNPKGISGCGVWRLSGLKRFKHWKPDEVRLVGIEHAWRKGDQLLKAVRIQYVLESLYKAYPNLRKIMDFHLGLTTQNW